MKESCARIVANQRLVPVFVRLLSSAKKWLDNQSTSPDNSTPKSVFPPPLSSTEKIYFFDAINNRPAKNLLHFPNDSL